MKKIKMTSSLQMMVFGVAILVASLASAQEDSSTSTTAKKSREEVRQAFETCASSLGIEKPEAGKRPEIDQATREKMDACLLAQGIEKPQRGRGGRPPHHRGERPQERETSSTGTTGVQ